MILYSRIQSNPPELLEEEFSLVTDVSPFRGQQIRTCRHLCRKGIESLGGRSNSPILSEKNGAPIFPIGFHGSISHTKSHCVVAVVRSNTISRIGIDIEEKAKYFEQHEWRLISTEIEREDAHLYPQLSMDQYVSVLFSTKEAIYKCVSGILVDELEFTDVVCRNQSGKSEFDVTVLRAIDPIYSQEKIATNWCIKGDLIISLAWMR